ncbi:hypothetical protein ACFWIB_39250 [Streptomyces sp. NPDC127051]|uniref:hypothetical protein n=1 Tax=Streptomyces sp. NPDC127051 TaxID=3347119 RepID=UPI00364F1A3E
MGTWWRKYLAGGRQALAVRRTRRSGRPELVTGGERAAVFQAMAGYTHQDLLLGGPLWTRPLVAELVRMAPPG